MKANIVNGKRVQKETNCYGKIWRLRHKGNEILYLEKLKKKPKQRKEIKKRIKKIQKKKTLREAQMKLRQERDQEGREKHMYG